VNVDLAIADVLEDARISRWLATFIVVTERMVYVATYPSEACS
jgi:hypothetical protein